MVSVVWATAEAPVAVTVTVLLISPVTVRLAVAGGAAGTLATNRSLVVLGEDP